MKKIMCFALLCLSSVTACAQTQVERLDEIRFKTGTGFFVNPQGYVVTSRHFARECGSGYGVYTSAGMRFAEKIAEDKRNDLMLLKTESPAEWAGSFRSPDLPLSKGDMLLAMGYPGATWKKMNPVAKKTQMIALTGPMGEEGMLQFSDSMALGNSGGPLVDNAGNIVGMVVAKKRIRQINSLTGKVKSVTQVDVAADRQVIEAFLEQNHVNFHHSSDTEPLKDSRLQASTARFIVNVRCRVREPN